MRSHDVTDEDALNQAALYALGQLTGCELAEFETHLDACAACRDELRSLRDVTDALALLAPPALPPSRLRRRLLEQLGLAAAPLAEPPAPAPPAAQPWKQWTARAEVPPLWILRHDEQGWEPTGVTGVDVRKLFADPAADRATMLVRMAPGTAYPSHRHGGIEECYVLEGDLYSDDFEMRPGDYQRLESGSVHAVQATRQGCLLFIVSSLHDELLDAAR